MSSFNIAMKTVFKNEGGYTPGKFDVGGETNWGISSKQYPDLDITNLTKAEALGIYLRDYWNGRGVNGITNQKVATFALDTVVQHGKGPAILQEAANEAGANLIIDNALGPLSRAAINKINPDVFIKNGVKVRLDYVDGLHDRGKLSSNLIEGVRTRINGFFLSPMIMTGTAGVILILLGSWYFLRTR